MEVTLRVRKPRRVRGAARSASPISRIACVVTCFHLPGFAYSPVWRSSALRAIHHAGFSHALVGHLVSASRVLTSSVAVTAFLVCAATATARAQSISGRWEGASVFRGDPTRATIALDSSGTAWTGTLSADGLPGGSVRLDSVSVQGNAVSMRMPASVAPAVLRGELTPDRLRIDGRVYLQGDSGVFHLARRGAPALTTMTTKLGWLAARVAVHGRDIRGDSR